MRWGLRGWTRGIWDGGERGHGGKGLVELDEMGEPGLKTVQRLGFRDRVCVIHWHCSAQLSMFNMEKRYRNKIIIIIIIIISSGRAFHSGMVRGKNDICLSFCC